MTKLVNIHVPLCDIPVSSQHSRSIFELGRSTYTAVVDNLDDGSELASEGTAADQDEAANLDQLPRSELDIDIGHGEGFLHGNESALELAEVSGPIALTIDNRGWMSREGCCRKKSDCPG